MTTVNTVLKPTYVTVPYDKRPDALLWCKERNVNKTIAIWPLMDDSRVGMSFLFEFPTEHAADAKAFAALFSPPSK